MSHLSKNKKFSPSIQRATIRRWHAAGTLRWKASRALHAPRHDWISQWNLVVFGTHKWGCHVLWWRMIKGNSIVDESQWVGLNIRARRTRRRSMVFGRWWRWADWVAGLDFRGREIFWLFWEFIKIWEKNSKMGKKEKERRSCWVSP